MKTDPIDFNNLLLSCKFVVSCQAEEGNPFNDDESVIKFAICAELGGANIIRSSGVERTKKIIEYVNLPVIGIVKSTFPDGYVGITIREKDVQDLMDIGCGFVAIDGTDRLRENHTGPEFISSIKSKFPDLIIMADVSTLTEGINCSKAGANYISTTLNGYTPWTKHEDDGFPNLKLVKDLISTISTPVVAEGRINNPKQAKNLLQLGCTMVVVGSAITRPHLITRNFFSEINKIKK